MQPLKPKTIDEYISGFPITTQNVLWQVFEILKIKLPKAEEAISYGIPTFKLNNTYVVYFAGYKKHISLYPAPIEHEDFKKDLAKYKAGKATVQFSLNKPLPIKLIEKIAKYLLSENLKRTVKTK